MLCDKLSMLAARQRQHSTDSITAPSTDSASRRVSSDLLLTEAAMGQLQANRDAAFVLLTALAATDLPAFLHTLRMR